MDSRGQLSAEYILIVGFLLAVILIVAVYVSDQTEQNTIATATRLGAVNASAEIGIMNRNITPIRVTKVEMTEGTDINIVVFLSSSLSDPQKQSILAGIQQSIESQGYIVNNYLNYLTINATDNTKDKLYLITLA